MDRYRYSNVLLNADKKKRYKEAMIMPTVPKTVDDIYVITAVEDRLDLLAYQYYKDSVLWWVIAAANPETRFDSLFLEPGIQLRIPSIETAGQILQIMQDQYSNR